MNIIKKAKERTAEDNRQLRNTVSDIIDNVCRNGDAALRDYSQRFDGFVRESFRVSREEIDAAYAKMDPADIEDLRAAKANIEAFAKAQLASMNEVTDFSPQPGIYLGHRIIPVSSCCCYVPGGRYPLFSTALMLITPAKVAGVKRVAATAPVVHGTGDIHYKTLVAMDLAGADEIYAVGGAQAIAAFSYGTEQIRPVDVIVGPGNQFVAEAKRQCYGQVGIDFIAGPSEVLVIADEAADPEVLAADLLAQCEHDPNAKAFLLATDETLAKATIAAVEAELETLETADVARQSWDDYGEVVLLGDLAEAVEVCNAYAPEHLEVNIQDPDRILDQLTNYGSLFIGGNTAEAFGDYASGTNHTLPTIKAARYTGGVWVGTFLKICTNQRMTPGASAAIAPLVNRMAKGEGLIAHAIAAEKRF
ncbi:MAG: histidinol dehydrogenase [Firmicutes bacterium]|nr:histidinol dehydrogenase [Bacillota bacterium]